MSQIKKITSKNAVMKHQAYMHLYPLNLRGISMFKTNDYFAGKVKSIAFQGRDKPATVGVMAAGEYVFNTSDKEKMTVISGELGIQLKAKTEVITYTAGLSFEVAENSEFNVKVAADCAYLCEYG